MDFDYVICGAGAAGCVLAYRLSENPAIRVALIEAGPRDRHPFIAMPKGLAKVMQDPKHLWVHMSEPEASTAGQSEAWVRGRVLGGSSSVNGMMYVRGQPADFDAIAEKSSDDWSWTYIGAAYRALENHELGGAATRGDAGPMKISMPTQRLPISDAQVAAGEAMGWINKPDVNAPDDQVAIGYAPRTIFKGKRQSAAQAFLRPAEKRPNLTVLTDRTVDRVIFDGPRAVGVEVVRNGARETIDAAHEVIVCGGAMASPAIPAPTIAISTCSSLIVVSFYCLVLWTGYATLLVPKSYSFAALSDKIFLMMTGSLVHRGKRFSSSTSSGIEA